MSNFQVGDRVVLALHGVTYTDFDCHRWNGLVGTIKGIDPGVFHINLDQPRPDGMVSGMLSLGIQSGYYVTIRRGGGDQFYPEQIVIEESPLP